MGEEIKTLKDWLADIDGLVKDNTIPEERGAAWKERIIAEFEAKQIPAEPGAKGSANIPIMETTDLGHLPGRVIGKGIPILKGFLQGCGATYKGLSEREGYDITLPGREKEGGRDKKKDRPKSPQELYKDLPEQYR
jgi:hypothetical protein